MNIIKKITLLFFVACLCTACFEDLDDTPISSYDIKDFVWKGMNYAYLYKENKPDLADDRFSSTSDYSSYLSAYETPEILFENLIYDRENTDRFSWITDDYIALEESFNGVRTSNGLEFDFYYEPGSTSNVFGIIRLVLNNSPAASQGLQRGQIFNAVNGVALTENNINTLLSQNNYTLNFATYNDNNTPSDDSDDTIDTTNETATLSKVAFTENPVHKTEILQVNNQNVGYLMYNGFTADFNTQLNNAFATLLNNNVQNLVLDLRYNPGGSVNTATLLGSMITGQFNGETFAKLIYNNDLQSSNTEYQFTDSFDGNSINSLNLQKVYILTTGTSASASEMVINSLKAYSQLEVIQIGLQTTGKSQASITIYDSPDFTRSGANSLHTYAMQPLVAKTVNKLDVSVPNEGLTPTIEINEDPSNYGVLGDASEPLLAAALQHISQNGRFSQTKTNHFNKIKNKIDYNPFENGMYLD
ncbi:peptidase S41 [Lacinutrix sp. C3R15]|uniref:S41 family peptidase n=1 Tax=Flavobacteriaceae TaxID=49546 RepID=UPI001C08D105|nr:MULTISPECIES: S41 family peptidase [Flavobacteriaceae]MBU2938867.1 peptidase S41 [Lacinutrix sp. C3R15]MDO6622180.1 S41 family peptidase [Oceanihabitans sp. 1_MG-2023]